MMKLKKHNKPEEIKTLDNETKNSNNAAEDNASVANKENPETAGELSKEKEIPDVKKLQEELEKKSKEIDILTDTMKRRQADFENYKKRMIKTQDEQKKIAIKDFALDIIDINDDLLRAFDASCNIRRDTPVEDICNTFSEGLSMISKRVEETLNKYGIKEIDSLNTAFDPACNEAIELEDSGQVDCDTITKVHQKGFRLDEYVLRPAKVKVSRPKKASGNNEIRNESSEPGKESVSGSTGENINLKA